MNKVKAYSNQSVSLTPTATSHHKAISITASSSLMTNYEPSRSVTANHKIKPVQDTQGNPIVFSVGTDNHLFAIARDPSSISGWKQFNVSGSVGDGWEVACFETCTTRNKDFMLAVALTKEHSVRFFITPMLTADPAADYWNDFSKQLVERKNDLGLQNVSSIQIGAGGTDGPAIIAEATVDGTNYDRYIVNSNPDDQGSLWTTLPLPQNAHTDDGSNPVVDVAIGKNADIGLTGTYSLYYVGKELQLTFDSIQKIDGQVISHEMTVPEGAQALATMVADPNGHTELYVAGNGIYRFPINGQGSGDAAAKIVTGLRADRHTELEVLTDGENIAIWFLDQGILRYVHGTAGDTPTWTTPMPIRADVGQIAALRNTALRTNEIFDVDVKNNLMYYYQDPSSTIWREHLISLPDIGQALPVQCYTTVLHFTDENNRPLREAVTLTASGWIYAIINGGSHILDRDTEVQITPDGSGKITVITRVSTAACPILSLESDNFKEIVDINPQNVLNENLKQFTTADRIRSAQTQCGDAVLPGNRPLTAPQLASAFSILTKASDCANPNTISVRPAGSSFHNLIKPGDLSKCIGNDHTIVVTNTLSTIMDSISGPLRSSPQSLVRGDENIIDAFFGDVWKAIRNDLQKVNSWALRIVDEGLQFVVHLEEGIASFVLDSIEKVYEVLSWILHQIEIGIEKLIEWLGFFFNWKDITKYKKVFRKIADMTMDKAKQEIGQVEGKINDTAAHIQSVLDSFTGDDFKKHYAGLNTKAQESKDRQQSKNNADDLMSSPAIHWIMYHLESFMKIIECAPEIHQFGPKVEKLIAKIPGDAGKDVKAKIQKMYDEVLKHPSNSPIEDSIAQIIDILGTTVIDATKDLIITQLELIEAAIEIFCQILSTEIEIPVISSIYKEFIGEGDPLTVLELACLVSAIPADLGCKLLGISGFSNSDVQFIEGATSFEELLSHDPQKVSAATRSEQAVAPGMFEGNATNTASPARVASAETSTEGTRIQGTPTWVDILVIVDQFGTAGINLVSGGCNTCIAIDPLGVLPSYSVFKAINFGMFLCRMAIVVVNALIAVFRYSTLVGISLTAALVIFGIPIGVIGIMVAAAGLLLMSCWQPLKTVMTPIRDLISLIITVLSIIYSMYSILSTLAFGAVRLLNIEAHYGKGHAGLVAEDSVLVISGVASTFAGLISTVTSFIEVETLQAKVAEELGGVVTGPGEAAVTTDVLAESAADILLSACIVGGCSLVQVAIPALRGVLMIAEVGEGYRVDVFGIANSGW